MADQTKKELKDRIDRLEQRVEELEVRLEERTLREHTPKKTENKQSSDTISSSWNPSAIQLDEQWLNRIGIGLLLIGVAFLFKYSIDQGWLIPPIRSAIGLGIGSILFIGGLQMNKDATPLKQIMLGGGIATFYITAFATYQLYAFVPYGIVWAFMIIVTLLALSLSLQQHEAVLSVVGTLGALGTPFMLYTGSGGIISLVLYISLVLAGASVVYFQKGWRSLLWSMAAGGAAVLIVGIINSTWDNEGAGLAERWALQSGVAGWAFVSWIVPLLRIRLLGSSTANWRLSNISNKDLSTATIHLMILIIPLLTLILSVGIWELSITQAGDVSILLAGLGGAGYWLLLKNERKYLANTHAFLGLIMITIGFVLLLEGNFLFAVLALEAAALRYVAHITGDQKISISSHLLFGIVTFWLLNVLRFSIGDDPGLWDVEALTQLSAIAVGGLIIPYWLSRSSVRQLYQIGSHLVLLFWFYQKLSGYENGQALTTVAWGIYAIILLVLGFIKYGRKVRLAGMATIFLVVGKLFLVDLSQLQAIWRILLFMGFGAAFLLLGYYWQSSWNDTE